MDGPLFPPVANNRTGTLDRPRSRLDLPEHRDEIRARDGHHAEGIGLCVHSLQATTATLLLDSSVAIESVQLHPRFYDRRRSVRDPTFHKVPTSATKRINNGLGLKA